MKETRIAFMGSKENEASDLFFKWLVEMEMIIPFKNYLQQNDIQVYDNWWNHDKNTVVFEVHNPT